MEAAEAEARIAYGGAENVKISVTWDNAADVDFWVNEPTGESIGYSLDGNSSSGRLLLYRLMKMNMAPRQFSGR